jgi:hypothetical protein
VARTERALRPHSYAPHVARAACDASLQDANLHLDRDQAACFARFAIFAIVALLQPVAFWIEVQLAPASIIAAMPALRSVSNQP